jgi:plastocyanin
MHKRLRSGAGIVVMAGALLLAACGGGGPAKATSSGSSSTSAASSGASSSSTTIIISNFMFGPMSTTVSPGATVSVTNKDSATHTLTATGGQFNTGDISQNQTKTFKAPTKPGKYSYICDIHQYMTGTLTVK